MPESMHSSTNRQPEIGCTKDELDTPALCIDLDVMDQNIRLIVEACRAAGVAWRPHIKGHRCGAIGVREVEAGALGLTCAKLGEAELMASSGVRDLLIANAIVGDRKLARLVELSRHADPIVAVDHTDQLRPLAAAFAAAGRAVRVVIEVDIGLARGGVEPGDAALPLAREAISLEGIDFVGLMAWEGHLIRIADRDEKERSIHDALRGLLDTKLRLEVEGIECPIVSCAGTGSFQISLAHPGITEVEAGGAIMMDVFYRE
ncbi:alanine racemase, partial [Gaiella sp.]|uniref:alanine racemase n=1 Tax=Gaiella sp. TaxID=2663207 RepID=UPI0039834690